jgi:exodeoxyribonuclease VII large subunit
VGHEVDFTIADFVADKRAPTPSAAVELVMPDRAELARRLERLQSSLARGWRRQVQGARQHLSLLSRRLPDLRRRVQDLRLKVDDRAEMLSRRLTRLVASRRQQVFLSHSRLKLLSPRRSATTARQRLEHYGQRLLSSWRQRTQEIRRHLNYSRSHLEKLNPLAILERGYAVATRLPEGAVIRDALEVAPETQVRVRVARGRLDCQVKSVTSNQ